MPCRSLFRLSRLALGPSFCAFLPRSSPLIDTRSLFFLHPPSLPPSLAGLSPPFFSRRRPPQLRSRAARDDDALRHPIPHPRAPHPSSHTYSNGAFATSPPPSPLPPGAASWRGQAIGSAEGGAFGPGPSPTAASLFERVARLEGELAEERRAAASREVSALDQARGSARELSAAESRAAALAEENAALIIELDGRPRRVGRRERERGGGRCVLRHSQAPETLPHYMPTPLPLKKKKKKKKKIENSARDLKAAEKRAAALLQRLESLRASGQDPKAGAIEALAESMARQLRGQSAALGTRERGESVSRAELAGAGGRKREAGASEREISRHGGSLVRRRSSSSSSSSSSFSSGAFFFLFS